MESKPVYLKSAKSFKIAFLYFFILTGIAQGAFAQADGFDILDSQEQSETEQIENEQNRTEIKGITEEIRKESRRARAAINEINKSIQSFDCEGIKVHLENEQVNIMQVKKEFLKEFTISFPDPSCRSYENQRGKNCSIFKKRYEDLKNAILDAQDFINNHCPNGASGGFFR